MLIQIIEGVYHLLWGDLLTLHLGNVTLSLSFKNFSKRAERSALL